MRDYRLIIFACFPVVLFALFGSLLVAPVPATYAQEILSDVPDLSGANIYFSEANQELSQFNRTENGVSRFAGLLRLAGANLFTLEWRKGIPPDADLIVIPGPNTDLTPETVARLWAYLQGGGRVLLAVDAFESNGAVSRALPARGLFELTWNDLGLRARTDVIVREGDLRPLEVVETNNNGDVTFEFSGELPVLHTDFLTRRVNDQHPITAGLGNLLLGGDETITPNLNSLFFEGARSLEIDAALDRTRVTPLVWTDDPTLYGETDYARFMRNGFYEYNIGTDSSRGNLILAAAYEDAVSGGRLVLLSDVDLLSNGSGFVTSPSYSGSFVYPANAQFAMNAASWLLDRVLVTLNPPTPAPTATPTIAPSPTPTPEPTATGE